MNVTLLRPTTVVRPYVYVGPPDHLVRDLVRDLVPNRLYPQLGRPWLHIPGLPACTVALPTRTVLHLAVLRVQCEVCGRWWLRPIGVRGQPKARCSEGCDRWHYAWQALVKAIDALDFPDTAEGDEHFRLWRSELWSLVNSSFNPRDGRARNGKRSP